MDATWVVADPWLASLFSAVGADRFEHANRGRSDVMASGLFQKKEPTGVWWRDHSLSLVLGSIMAAQTVYALWAGVYVWTREQPLGSLPAWGEAFWMWWGWEYNISLVADTFGVLLIVMLSKWLKEVGSAESK